MAKIVCNNKLFDSINQIDFIDIGGSKGDSYKFIQKKFNFKFGLSIDIDPNKINEALKNNIPMIRLDATNMNIFNSNACKLISIIHTLEHLPNITIIEQILKESIRVASDKLYIKGPMYYQQYLSSLGFQFYWSYWKGHTCLIEPEQIIKIMNTLGQKKFTLNFINKVTNSSDPCIHPINGKIDRHGYDVKIDPPKKMNVIFNKDIFKEFELIFTLN